MSLRWEGGREGGASGEKMEELALLPGSQTPSCDSSCRAVGTWRSGVLQWDEGAAGLGRVAGSPDLKVRPCLVVATEPEAGGVQGPPPLPGVQEGRHTLSGRPLGFLRRATGDWCLCFCRSRKLRG